MRRSLSIFLWILLGACASGIGMGYVLWQAQDQTRSLNHQLERTQEQAKAIAENHERLIQEADQKVALATAEALQSKDLLAKYEQEQLLLAQTSDLSSYRTKTKTWNQIIAFPIGLSLRLPPNTFGTSTDYALLATTGGSSYQSGDLWLSATTYQPEQEHELSQGLFSTSSFAYRVDQTLILGQRGQKANVNGNIYVLRIQRQGKQTHLLWIRTNPTVNDARVLEILSTLSFGT